MLPLVAWRRISVPRGVATTTTTHDIEKLAKHARICGGVRPCPSIDLGRSRTARPTGRTIGWVMFWLWHKVESGTNISKERYFGPHTHLQTGQVPLDFSHGVMQPSWNGCLQGSVTITWSSGSSVFSENCSLHTAQSRSNSTAANVQHNPTRTYILLTSFF